MTPATKSSAILVINSGSSSVKFALFAAESDLPRLFAGALERIGLAHTRFHARDHAGIACFDDEVSLPNHREALRLLIKTIKEHLTGGSTLLAVDHRIAHGGPDCDCSRLVTDVFEAKLRQLIPLAPLHQPHNLAGISAIREFEPSLPQVACFDTAFHHGLPRFARMTGLPRTFQIPEIRRYGFHGLSYESLVEMLREEGVDVDRDRIIAAHLGNGASMCALRNGRSVETTMGFSTLSGLMMGTRSGDMHPGAILYLMNEKGLDRATVQTLLYERSGLLGVSGISSDMRELLARQGESAARDAVDLFCYRAQHHVAALTAVLGGLDRLVFTGGIGTNAAEIRQRICSWLDYLGIKLDVAANNSGVGTIFAQDSTVKVQALKSDEERMIARHVLRRMTEVASFDEAGCS